MYSCEYLSVTGTCQSKRLCLRNIRFYQGGKEIQYNNRSLPSSDYIFIIFEDRKNGEKYDTITMQRAYELLLCPVCAWDKIVQHISSYPSATLDTYVNTFIIKGEI